MREQEKVSWFEKHIEEPLFIGLGIKVALIFLLLFSFSFVPFSRLEYHFNHQFRDHTARELSNPSFSGTVPFMFTHFDAQWYMQIARDGYNPNALLTEPRNIAFFPLYPALIRGVSYFTGVEWAAFLIANIASLAAGILFFALIRQFLARYVPSVSESHAHTLAVFGLMLFFLQPMGVFLLTSYTEGLFFASIFAAILALWKDKVWIAALCGMCAVLLKVQGVVLLPVLLLILWETRTPRRVRWSDLSLLLIPAAYLLWHMYLWYITGEPLAGFEIQKVFGVGRPLGFQPQKLLESLQMMTFDIQALHSAHDILSLFLTLLIIPLGWKILPPSLRLWSFGVILIPVMSWSFMSMMRYLMLVFPVLLLIIYWSRNSPLLRWLTLGTSTVLCMLFAVMYTHHYWVG